MVTFFVQIKEKSLLAVFQPRTVERLTLLFIIPYSVHSLRQPMALELYIPLSTHISLCVHGIIKTRSIMWLIKYCKRTRGRLSIHVQLQLKDCLRDVSV